MVTITRTFSQAFDTLENFVDAKTHQEDQMITIWNFSSELSLPSEFLSTSLMLFWKDLMFHLLRSRF